MDELKSKFQTDQHIEINYELPSGHSNRFQKRIQEMEKRKTIKIFSLTSVGIAASILIGLLIFNRSENKLTTEDPKLGDISYEMSRLEDYYIERIGEAVLPEPGNDPILQKQMEDFDRLDREYATLRKALNQNYGNQRVIDAMIHNYKMRILILEQMQRQFEFKQQRSNPQNNVSNI